MNYYLNNVGYLIFDSLFSFQETFTGEFYQINNVIERPMPKNEDDNMIFHGEIHIMKDYIRYERR